MILEIIVEKEDYPVNCAETLLFQIEKKIHKMRPFCFHYTHKYIPEEL